MPADPERDAAFSAAIAGWVLADGHGAVTLRHPSGCGPLLETCSQPRVKTATIHLHLDVRPGPGEDTGEQVERTLDLGARRVDHGWGDPPWTVLVDPPGHELCMLPGR